MVESKDPVKGAFFARDLPGFSKLTIGAITGMIDLVESFHQTVSGLDAIQGVPAQHRTKGITGMVYRNIRSVTELVGKGLEPLLKRFSEISEEQGTSQAREALLAALNGVVGDHLAEQDNELAIPLQFRQNGKALDLEAVCQAVGQSQGRIVILAHGLCMNDLQWCRQGHDHGAELARDLGCPTIYLHYNSGRHISENGRSFSNLLETTIAEIERQTKLPVELNMVTHSMGGLVSRSAHHYGVTAGHHWPKRLRKLIFLGTPHQGALLEKGGNLLDVILEANSYSAPFSRLGKVRSHGITDLRYGYVVDEDWLGPDGLTISGDHRTPVPLPRGVDCYAIASTIQAEPGKLGDGVIGDGLVSLNSALGRHSQPQWQLAFPPDHQWIGRDMNHFDLLNHPKVYATIIQWLTR